MYRYRLTCHAYMDIYSVVKCLVECLAGEKFVYTNYPKTKAIKKLSPLIAAECIHSPNFFANHFKYLIKPSPSISPAKHSHYKVGTVAFVMIWARGSHFQKTCRIIRDWDQNQKANSSDQGVFQIAN